MQSLLITVNGNIGFLRRFFEIQIELGDRKTLQEKEERNIEILIFLTGYKKPIGKLLYPGFHSLKKKSQLT
jgi:hypothetical protein